MFDGTAARTASRAFMTGVLKALRDEQGEMIGYSKICLDDTGSQAPGGRAYPIECGSSAVCL